MRAVGRTDLDQIAKAYRTCVLVASCAMFMIGLSSCKARTDTSRVYYNNHCSLAKAFYVRVKVPGAGTTFPGAAPTVTINGTSATPTVVSVGSDTFELCFNLVAIIGSGVSIHGTITLKGSIPKGVELLGGEEGLRWDANPPSPGPVEEVRVGSAALPIYCGEPQPVLSMRVARSPEAGLMLVLFNDSAPSLDTIVLDTVEWVAVDAPLLVDDLEWGNPIFDSLPWQTAVIDVSLPPGGAPIILDIPDAELTSHPWGIVRTSGPNEEAQTIVQASFVCDHTPMIDQVLATITSAISRASVALDGASMPHVVYWADGDLRHGYRLHGQWFDEVVDDSPNDTGVGPSIAVDSRGVLHVAYRDQTNGDLLYAVRDEGTWQIEVVDWNGDVGSHASIALDPDDQPMISYRDASARALKFAKKDAGWWTIEYVDGSPYDVGRYSSLVVSGATPHISYQDVSNKDLKYATKIGDSWRIEVVDGSGDVGASSSLALDADGNPHISYQEETQSDALYAEKVGATWQREIVASAGSCRGSSLCLDRAGLPQVLFVQDFQLIHAWKDGAEWTTEVLGESAFEYVSSSLDDCDQLTVAYYAPGPMRLRCLTPSGDLPASIPPVEPPADRTLMVRAFPNPFRNQVSFAIAATGQTEITVLDSAGGVVRRFSSSGGATAPVWDGRDEKGQAVPSGAYFARMAVGDTRATARLIKID